MTAPVPNRKIKTLVIDFDLYTDGDPSFKDELILMMMDNIQELLQSYETSQKDNDHDKFRKVCHKVLSTVSMIGDQELISVMEKLKDPSNPDANEHAAILKGLCHTILDMLSGELTDKLY
jgi:hypothetical protein